MLLSFIFSKEPTLCINNTTITFRVDGTLVVKSKYLIQTAELTYLSADEHEASSSIVQYDQQPNQFNFDRVLLDAMTITEEGS